MKLTKSRAIIQSTERRKGEVGGEGLEDEEMKEREGEVGGEGLEDEEMKEREGEVIAAESACKTATTRIHSHHKQQLTSVFRLYLSSITCSPNTYHR